MNGYLTFLPFHLVLFPLNANLTEIIWERLKIYDFVNIQGRRGETKICHFCSLFLYLMLFVAIGPGVTPVLSIHANAYSLELHLMKNRGLMNLSNSFIS